MRRVCLRSMEPPSVTCVPLATLHWQLRLRACWHLPVERSSRLVAKVNVSFCNPASCAHCNCIFCADSWLLSEYTCDMLRHWRFRRFMSLAVGDFPSEELRESLLDMCSRAPPKGAKAAVRAIVALYGRATAKVGVFLLTAP